MSDDTKPTILVLGGCGFIGRNFIKYLSDNHLCKKIRVVDKTHPSIAYMSEEYKIIFENKNLIQYIQCDLSKEIHVTKAFADEKFDYVFNLCGETRFGLAEDEYKKKSVEPAVKCIAASVANGIKNFIEISTAHVYEPSDTLHKEKSDIKPWTIQANSRFQVEKLLAASNLPHVILRPAYVYGPGDNTSITPRLTCAAAYKIIDEKMEFLWGSDLKINTVHVYDLCKAMWHVRNITDKSVYNLADSTNLDQGKLNKIIETMFGIRTGFHGYFTSNLALLALDTVANTANEKHMEPWQLLCKKHNIDTNLSPYIDKELLKNNHLCVDGSKIIKDLNFKYDYPQINEETLRAQINGFINQKLFPPVLQK